MQQYVEGDFEGAYEPGDSAKKSKRWHDKKGPAGNVVPFFPSEWKKNSNDVFNLGVDPELTETAYADDKHAAVYRKVEDPNKSQNAWLKKWIKEEFEKGERPTSGKHYARI